MPVANRVSADGLTHSWWLRASSMANRWVADVYTFRATAHFAVFSRTFNSADRRLARNNTIRDWFVAFIFANWFLANWVADCGTRLFVAGPLALGMALS